MKIIEFIPTGRANAITADELAARTGLDKRAVRKAVLSSRCNGVPVCSDSSADGGHGYFLPLDRAEASTYYREQISRIKTGMRALSAVKKFIDEDGEMHDEQ